MIRQALERCRWRRGDAAEALGLNLRTLQRKMKRLGMGRWGSEKTWRGRGNLSGESGMSQGLKTF